MTETLYKIELIDQVAASTDLTQGQCETAINAALKIIQETLVGGDRVVITNFGTFTPKMRKGRKGVHPSTGKPLIVAPKKVVTFKAGSGLADAVKNS